ncbi:hypothetical protein AB7714_28295 [Tardiphaga sp. 1201_B9_N1_1]|uniref:hypothetical protein n=1 Tax=unclassified Tardiphaga TaxID=2631404 RepID=UPI003F220AFF
MDIEKLHAALSDIAPIVGVSIGRKSDKTTWRVDFMQAATPAQKEAAALVISEFDASAEAVPPVISDRQFFQQLAVAGIISQDEALAAVQVGEIPPALDTLIALMPPDAQFNARMIVSGGTTFERSHPLTIAVGSAYGMTGEQMDLFWIAAAAL